MKLQIKRSNVLLDGAAKAPSDTQMEYGELAVNYNSTDPVLFIKDSNDNVIRLTNINQVVDWSDIENKPTIPTVNDGQINVEVNQGLSVSGDNATANQSTDTTRTISLVVKADGGIVLDNDGLSIDSTKISGAPGYGIAGSASGLILSGDWSNIPVLPS